MQTYKLLKEDTVLLTQPDLVEKFGHSTSLFLSQLNYWIQKESGVFNNNKRWIYNTAKEWGEQLKISSRQIERIIKKLKDMGILVVGHFNKHNRVNYITINYEELSKYTGENILTDTMSELDRHNVGIHIKNTKITNKENNKSKGQGDKKNDSYSSISSRDVDQVEQVVDNCLNDNKNFCKINKSHPQKLHPLKKTIAQDMLHLWHKMFPKCVAVMDKDLAKQLVATFNHKCQKKLEHWKNYLDRLQSSTVIMSRQFNLTISWALKFKTIDRILQGDLGAKDVPIQPKQEYLKQLVEQHISSVDEDNSIKEVRFKIARIIGYASYLSWFTKVAIIYNNKGFHLKAGTPFVQDYITTHFGHLFLR
jgi:hypothetical protein